MNERQLTQEEVAINDKLLNISNQICKILNKDSVPMEQVLHILSNIIFNMSIVLSEKSETDIKDCLLFNIEKLTKILTRGLDQYKNETKITLNA